ncbi:MAG: glycosyltransferase family 39 protein, partial [Bacteroidetes bacterium]|nr:glycosyltransferase family 39 protein [Bacteroidota bacterium]
MMILSSGLVLSFIQPGTIITDGGIFSSIAYKDLNGGTLYVDAWENKPPGIFYLIELFMLVIPEPVYAVFILSVLALVGLSLLVYTFIFNSTNSLSASLSLGTIGSAIILFKPNCGDGLYTEIYGTLSLVGAMILIHKLNLTGKTKYLNYSLILIGLSIWFKEPFVLISIPIILYIFSKGHFKNK